MAAANADFEFLLNGRTTRVSRLPAQLTLLDFARSQGFTGAKEGCAEGECGACAMLLVSENGATGCSAFRSVNSCLIPLPAIAGQEIYTVEGLTDSGAPCEVQRAMAAGGGSQCGYCTPGFVVSMFAEQHRCGAGERDVHALGGNLCRCTGYRPIQEALLSLGEAPESRLKARLAKPAPELKVLAYPGFSRPVSIEAALRLAAEDPDARFVGGNTDLGVVTNLRDTRFPHLISLQAIPELRGFSETPEAVEIGAALTLTEIGERWKAAPPVFREWLPLFASLLIRNRATLGGNLATASPIGDSAPLLLALGAQVRLASLRGERLIPLSGFFRGYRQTALEAGEILRAIRIPKPFPPTARFYKVAKRSMDDISTVAACIAAADGRVRIGLGGVAATPVLAEFPEAEFESAGPQLAARLQPLSDHRGSAAYRLAMVESLISKFRAWQKGEA